MKLFRTAEHVSRGHPDKFSDIFVDAVLDKKIELAKAADQSLEANHPSYQRAAFEVAAKDRLVLVTGEGRAGPGILSELDVGQIGRDVWADVGYGDGNMVTILNHIQMQSPELSVSSDRDGAGDQGIMVGFATDETETMMPLEYELARKLCKTIYEARAAHPWIGADIKTQVTLDGDQRPARVVIAVQHDESVVVRDQNDTINNDATCAEIKARLMEIAITPVFGEDIDPAIITVNGTGSFIIGGTIGDAGVVGRKVVVDAYGPRVPVGGGAYSGKDPTKVDRSAAYMARKIAKTAVHHRIKGARSVLVHIAFCIGLRQPEMVTAVTDQGVDISDWVHTAFPELSPSFIIEDLDLWRTNPDSNWTYKDAAGFGHYGRNEFPWEQIADVSD